VESATLDGQNKTKFLYYNDDIAYSIGVMINFQSIIQPTNINIILYTPIPNIGYM
jgi:hypothetical protein